MNNFEKELRLIRDLRKPTDFFKKELYDALIDEIYSLWNNNIEAWSRHGGYIRTQHTHLVMLTAGKQFPTNVIENVMMEVLVRIRTEFTTCSCGNDSTWRDCCCGNKCQVQLFQTI